VEPLRSNPKNDRAKREYLIYLKDARRRSPATVEQIRHAIERIMRHQREQEFQFRSARPPATRAGRAERASSRL
jgi:hypothetical protein